MRTSWRKSVLTVAAATAVLVLSACSGGQGSGPAPNGSEGADPSSSIGDRITFGMDPSFAPYAFQSAEGKLQGFNIDLADAIGEELGVEVVIETVAWDGIIPALDAGQIDVIPSIAVTEDRKKVVLFSADIMTKYLTTVVRKDRKDLNPGASDLKDLKVGVQAASDSAFAAEELKLPMVTEYNSIEDMYSDIILGRIDTGIVGNLDSGYTVSRTYPDDLRVTGVDLGAGKAGVNAAFRLGDTALKEAFDQAVVRIDEAGVLDALVARWFGDVG